MSSLDLESVSDLEDVSDFEAVTDLEDISDSDNSVIWKDELKDKTQFQFSETYYKTVSDNEEADELEMHIEKKNRMIIYMLMPLQRNLLDSMMVT